MYDKDLVGKKLTQRQYKKLMSKRQKQFDKLCKNFKIWDWEYIHDLLVFIIEWMKDFHCENPESFCDKEWIKNRREEFEKILRLQKDYIEFNDAATKVFNLATERIRTTTELKGMECQSVTVKVIDEDLERKSLDYQKSSDEAFVSFYKTIGENIRNWWD